MLLTANILSKKYKWIYISKCCACVKLGSTSWRLGRGGVISAPRFHNLKSRWEWLIASSSGCFKFRDTDLSTNKYRQFNPKDLNGRFRDENHFRGSNSDPSIILPVAHSVYREIYCHILVPFFFYPSAVIIIHAFLWIVKNHWLDQPIFISSIGLHSGPTLHILFVHGYQISYSHLNTQQPIISGTWPDTGQSAAPSF